MLFQNTVKIKTSEDGEIITTHNRLTELGYKTFFNLIFTGNLSVSGGGIPFAYRLGLINNDGYIDDTHWNWLTNILIYWQYTIKSSPVTLIGYNPEAGIIEGAVELGLDDNFDESKTIIVDEYAFNYLVSNDDYIKIDLKRNYQIRGMFLYSTWTDTQNDHTNAFKPLTVIIFPEVVFTDKLWVKYEIYVPIK